MGRPFRTRAEFGIVQVTRHGTRTNAEVPNLLYEERSDIAARAASKLARFSGRLRALLITNSVSNGFANARVHQLQSENVSDELANA
jgi:hypothetical protein